MGNNFTNMGNNFTNMGYNFTNMGYNFTSMGYNFTKISLLLHNYKYLTNMKLPVQYGTVITPCAIWDSYNTL